MWHVPAYEVKAVDTTGAGDCFHGAYAFALTQGKQPVACAVYATAAAAISRDRPGRPYGSAGSKRLSRVDGEGKCARAQTDCAAGLRVHRTGALDDRTSTAQMTVSVRSEAAPGGAVSD